MSEQEVQETQEATNQEVTTSNEPSAISPEEADFYARYRLAILSFYDTHPGYKLPIIRDQAGKLRWVNRAERRALGIKLGRG